MRPDRAGSELARTTASHAWSEPQSWPTRWTGSLRCDGVEHRDQVGTQVLEPVARRVGGTPDSPAPRTSYTTTVVRRSRAARRPGPRPRGCPGSRGRARLSGRCAAPPRRRAAARRRRSCVGSSRGRVRRPCRPSSGRGEMRQPDSANRGPMARLPKDSLSGTAVPKTAEDRRAERRKGSTPRGPDGVPGEGALREARRAGVDGRRRRERRGRPRRSRSTRRSCRRQGAGQGRWSRQGRWRQARGGRRRRGREGRSDPRHGHQGPHRAPGAHRADGRHRGGVLLLVPGRSGGASVPLHRQHRGRCRDRGHRAREPGRDRPRRHRPAGRRRRREGTRDRRGDRLR